MFDIRDMRGRNVLVTGASRGIGEATARLFAGRGARVTLAARTLPRIEAIASDLRDAGAEAVAVQCDVADYAQVAQAVETARDGPEGRLDVLVGNAGVIEPIIAIERSDPASWGASFDVNAKGIYHGLRAALPIMRRQGGGVIVNVSSGAAHQPLEGWSQYCAGKAAAAMLTRAAHHEAGRVVRVVGLSPGTVATQMQREIKASGVNPVSRLEWEDHIPPDWPARAILWLCGPDGAAFAGEEIRLRDEEMRERIGLGR
ncbi:MAG: SDR family oxidoreductase [Rubricella sp.]